MTTCSGIVLTREPVRIRLDEMLEDGEEVIVSGTVHYLIVADLERELGWDLDTEIETEYSGKPVVIAEAVTRTSEVHRFRK